MHTAIAPQVAAHNEVIARSDLIKTKNLNDMGDYVMHLASFRIIITYNINSRWYTFEVTFRMIVWEVGVACHLSSALVGV